MTAPRCKAFTCNIKLAKQCLAVQSTGLHFFHATKRAFELSVHKTILWVKNITVILNSTWFRLVLGSGYSDGNLTTIIRKSSCRLIVAISHCPNFRDSSSPINGEWFLARSDTDSTIRINVTVRWVLTPTVSWVGRGIDFPRALDLAIFKVKRMISNGQSLR